MKAKEELNVSCYEASLTPQEREKLHELLRSEKMGKVLAASIPWRNGEHKGEKPCRQTLHRIKTRLDLDDVLLEIKEVSTFIEGTRQELDAFVKGTDAEKVLDRAMALIGQEVIYRTLKGLCPEARNAAARLLLKRADQRRVDRRLDMVEAEFKKDASADAPETGLTQEEKKSAVKQILGIS